MELACLDLEGVLVPEICIAFAERTGIAELRATTRDIPDYDVLMKQRLRLLDQHGLKINDIQEVIATLEPLPGAIEFVDWLRERFQVIILSDTFYEFSQPLMRQLHSAGALRGLTEPEAFQVECGPQTMSQADIDAGRAIAEVSFAPAHSLEFIEISLLATAGNIEQRGAGA